MKTAKLRVIALVIALCPFALQATPIQYSFTTGNAPFGDPTLAPLFTGMSVNGSFVYDPATPALTTVPPPFVTAGSTIYLNAMSNLQGSVGASSFSDSVGRVIVGDDKFDPSPPTPATDILVLRADPSPNTALPPGAFDFMGFDIAGFTLSNARMFWIEGQLGITDFLSDRNLPATLPDFGGRFVLDFTPTNNPGPLSFVIFDGFTVTQVPEPATLTLLVAGLAGLALGRRRT